MSRRASTLVVASGLAVVLGIVGVTLPVPYVGLGPGPVFNTLGTVAPDRAGAKPIIKITGTKTYPDEGRLDLTTVSLYGSEDPLSLADALSYWFDRDFAVVPREVIFPEDKSPEEVKQEVAEEMRESQETAVTAALRELDVPVRRVVVVHEVVADTPAAAALRKEDVITAVDGTAVDDDEEARAILRRRRPGDPVRVTYRRDGNTSTVTLRTTTGTGNVPVIGVRLREDNEYPFSVTLETKDVGGPSAGLMFALGIIEFLTPGSLTNGVHVAGTGTITDDGAVGPIGGIQQKLIAAKRSGADYFLVPAGNMADARRTAPDGLELREVATLDQALDALREIRGSG